jgi:hypothetical protein
MTRSCEIDLVWMIGFGVCRCDGGGGFVRGSWGEDICRVLMCCLFLGHQWGELFQGNCVTSKGPRGKVTSRVSMRKADEC